MIRILFLTFLFSFFSAGYLSAQNFYIDNEANGLNNGTNWNDAWQSFADINWDLVNAGTTIYISGGTESKTYYENIIVPEGKSGSSGNRITITRGLEAEHNGTVIFDGINISDLPAIWIENSSYITVSNLNLVRWFCYPTDRGTIGVFDCSYITIDKNDILGWSQGIKIQGSQNCLIRNNSYTTPDSIDNQTDGIYASENVDNIYEGNYINISNADDNHNDCFQGQYEGPCIIQNNYFTHSGRSALKSVDSQGLFDKYSNGLHQYINNFIYLPNKSTSQQQMNDGVLDQQNPLTGDPASVILLNNTIVGASTHTLSIQAEEVIAKNNLIIMLDDISVTRFENVSDRSQIDFNIYYKDNRLENEVINGFSNFSDWQSAGGDLNGQNINPQVGANFQTLPSTPPIDAGTDLTNFGVTDDIEGNPRPLNNGFDIGAYEVENSVSNTESNNYEPADFFLDQNYPNPFNPSTKISFNLPHSSNIELSIFNLLGEKITNLINSEYPEGHHTIEFMPEHMPSGIYLYRLSADDFFSYRKMIYMK